MRKYQVEIPQTKYWQQQIKCQDACPVRTDARGYVRAIAEGQEELAYLIARGPNPLASICGRICGAPCEAACRRADFDESISIRALKRFVTEKFGVESGRYDESPLRIIERLDSMKEDVCTDVLQQELNNGWRIIAICVQADQRRPDYILGRYNASLEVIDKPDAGR